MKPQVSILVLNYNGKAFLDECFNALAKQTYAERDVWLVDNASQDGSVEYVRADFPEVKILAFEENHGFGGAYNRAVKDLETPYVAFLNNDTVVEEHWLETLVEALEFDPSAAVVGSKILFYDRRNVINSAGLKISPVGIGYDKGFGEQDTGQFDQKSYVAGICGASLMIRTEIFRKAGGFDEDYFLYGEDVDLCWRLLLRGHKIVYEPRSVVFHHYGGTAGDRDAPLRVYYMHRNMARNIMKNFGLYRLCRGLLIFTGYSFFRLIVLTLAGEWHGVRGVFRASLDTFIPRKQILKQRRTIQRERVVTDRQLHEHGWMGSLWDSSVEYFRTLHI